MASVLVMGTSGRDARVGVVERAILDSGDLARAGDLKLGATGHRARQHDARAATRGLANQRDAVGALECRRQQIAARERVGGDEAVEVRLVRLRLWYQRVLLVELAVGVYVGFVGHDALSTGESVAHDHLLATGEPGDDEGRASASQLPLHAKSAEVVAPKQRHAVFLR